MVFTDIVTTRADAPAGLRALGLPATWTRYAGHYYWDTGSVRTNPQFSRYEDKFSDGNIARYLVTHPSGVVRIGQSAAEQAQRVQVTALGDYPVSAGRRPGAVESRVRVVYLADAPAAAAPGPAVVRAAVGRHGRDRPRGAGPAGPPPARGTGTAPS